MLTCRGPRPASPTPSSPEATTRSGRQCRDRARAGVRAAPCEKYPSRLLCDPRRLVCVIPPDEREARLTVFWQLGWTTKAIPARGTHLRIGPLRHDVVVPQQHTVERFGRGDEIVAIRGIDHPLDQLVDRRILNADN